MPKYYVDDTEGRHIVDAANPYRACEKFIYLVGGFLPLQLFYRISEKGFDKHDDDIKIKSFDVINFLLDEKDRNEA